MRLTDIRGNAVWQALRGDGHVPKKLLVLTGTFAVIVPVGRFIPPYLQGNDLTCRISCWNQHPRFKVEAPHAVYPEKTGYASQLASAFGKDGGRNETCDKPFWGTVLEDIVLANRRNQLLILLLRFPVTVDPRKIGRNASIPVSLNRFIGKAAPVQVLTVQVRKLKELDVQELPIRLIHHLVAGAVDFHDLRELCFLYAAANWGFDVQVVAELSVHFPAVLSLDTANAMCNAGIQVQRSLPLLTSGALHTRIRILDGIDIHVIFGVIAKRTTNVERRPIKIRLRRHL